MRRITIAQMRKHPWVAKGYTPTRPSMDVARPALPADLFRESVAPRELTQASLSACLPMAMR